MIGSELSFKVQNLPIGVAALRPLSIDESGRARTTLSVNTPVKFTELTRIWCLPSSSANCFVTISSAALDTQYAIIFSTGFRPPMLKNIYCTELRHTVCHFGIWGLVALCDVILIGIELVLYL